MQIVCPANGTPPEPCLAGEGFTLTQIVEWPSVLRALGPRDEFKTVTFELRCESGVSETASAVTGSWTPVVGTNKFTFSAASGTFEVLGTEFVFMGSLKLTPAFYANVRG